MKLRIVMATAAVLGLPGAAMADGLPSYPAFGCCASPTWSGVYAGFQAGGAWGDTEWTFPFADTFNTVPGQHFASHPDGAIVGAQLGINRQFGAFLIGGEVSFAGTSLHQTQTGPVTAGVPLERFKTTVSNLFTATGRAGVVADKLLFYGKGGYANSNVDLSAISGPPVPGVTANANRASDGWTVGGGLEYRLRRSLVLGVEYDYVDLGSARFATATPFTVDLGDVHFHTVTARLSILLDRDPTAAPLK